MRNSFASAVINYCNTPDQFFLTGDLGFMALENIRDAFGPRFLNMGVAEQNMISVAAGLAKEGLKVFVYSIAPFCYARPYEQIRNDLCIGRLPVCLIGNGGGYAYGHMGPTHHALEDCAAMNALGVSVLVPAFDEDIPVMLRNISAPTYLRLGYDARPPEAAAPAYASWRLILPGNKGTMVSLGPMGGLAWSALRDLPNDDRPEVWVITELPLTLLPELFLSTPGKRSVLYIIEEHVSAGGLGMQLALAIANDGRNSPHLIHRHACGYPTGRFGSQAYHRAQCGLDADSIRTMVLEQKVGR